MSAVLEPAPLFSRQPALCSPQRLGERLPDDPVDGKDPLDKSEEPALGVSLAGEVGAGGEGGIGPGGEALILFQKSLDFKVLHQNTIETHYQFKKELGSISSSGPSARPQFQRLSTPNQPRCQPQSLAPQSTRLSSPRPIPVNRMTVGSSKSPSSETEEWSVDLLGPLKNYLRRGEGGVSSARAMRVLRLSNQAGVTEAARSLKEVCLEYLMAQLSKAQTVSWEQRWSVLSKMRERSRGLVLRIWRVPSLQPSSFNIRLKDLRDREQNRFLTAPSERLRRCLAMRVHELPNSKCRANRVRSSDKVQACPWLIAGFRQLLQRSLHCLAVRNSPSPSCLFNSAATLVQLLDPSSFTAARRRSSSALEQLAGRARSGLGEESQWSGMAGAMGALLRQGEEGRERGSQEGWGDWSQ